MIFPDTNGLISKIERLESKILEIRDDISRLEQKCENLLEILSCTEEWEKCKS